MKNWKTTLSGVLAVLPQILHLLFPTKVTSEVAAAISAAFVALGLVAAKDGNAAVQ